MGKIVFAGAMSHVLDPEYYDRACGPVGKATVETCMAEIARMGERLSAARPDALIVVADDHLNAFSFNAVPALCVRIGREVQRMAQDPSRQGLVKQMTEQWKQLARLLDQLNQHIAAEDEKRQAEAQQLQEQQAAQMSEFALAKQKQDFELGLKAQKTQFGIQEKNLKTRQGMALKDATTAQSIRLRSAEHAHQTRMAEMQAEHDREMERMSARNGENE